MTPRLPLGRTPMALVVAALIAATALALLPIYALLATAMNPSRQWAGGIAGLWPADWDFSAVNEAFGNLGGGRALLNSLLVALPAAVLGLAACIPAAYVMAMKSFKGDGTLRLGIFLAAAVSPIVYVAGTWRAAAMMGLWDTRPVVFLLLAANPAVILLLRAAFLRLPAEMIDAARLDGLSDVAILRQMVLPLTRRALVPAGVLHFVIAWNALVFPMIMIDTPANRMATAAAAELARRPWTPWPQAAAMALLSALPVLLVYLASSRPIIDEATAWAEGRRGHASGVQ